MDASDFEKLCMRSYETYRAVHPRPREYRMTLITSPRGDPRPRYRGTGFCQEAGGITYTGDGVIESLQYKPHKPEYIYAYVKCGRKAYHLGDAFKDWEEVSFERGDYVEHITYRKNIVDATLDDRILAEAYRHPFDGDDPE